MRYLVTMASHIMAGCTYNDMYTYLIAFLTGCDFKITGIIIYTYLGCLIKYIYIDRIETVNLTMFKLFFEGCIEKDMLTL